MLDDIIEIAIDVLGDILELVINAKRRSKKEREPTPQKAIKKTLPEDPWARSDLAEPWTK